jgi:proton-coupled amino acid transporter
MLHYKAISKTRAQRIADVALVLFGIIGMCYTTVLTVQSWVTGPKKHQPGYCDEK